MLKQANRLLGLSTPLGVDQLVITGFSGTEATSQLFRFKLQMISDNGQIKPTEIVGKNVTFTLRLADGSPRYFNGYVSQFARGDQDEKGRRNYTAEVVPWLWFLTRTSDCRVFQNKKAPEIIEQIFQEMGFTDYEVSLKGDFSQREYCIQYRETDFDFVSRLMEEEGIFYWFKHKNGKHTMVLADHIAAYRPCLEEELDFPRDLASARKDCLTSWDRCERFRTGNWTINDYNYETPTANLMALEQTTLKTSVTQGLEFYDYPGRYKSTSEGRSLAKVRMEAEEATHDIVQAASTCRSLVPGGTFKVRTHRSDSEQGQQFLITSLTHFATETSSYETGNTSGDSYRNEMKLMPAGTILRAPHTTPKKTVKGIQTAVVVGPAGEEIHTEKTGQVKIQFHWDREGKHDENSCCWVRVAQFWAGQNWGAHFWPRIGHEVVVAFLEGDMDRPLIIGSVYNADNLPPYELPKHQTRSGIKTRSTPGGSSDNFNEIRFEDKKGKEELYIHAERSMVTIVEGGESRSAGNRHTTIGGDDELVVKKGDRKNTVEKGHDSLDVKEGNIDRKAPAGTFGVVAKLVEIEGTDGIILKSGGSQIIIKPDSIDIISSNITNTGGVITIDGASISSTTGGVHTITGSPVKINC